jgi:hypothetical protein
MQKQLEAAAGNNTKAALLANIKCSSMILRINKDLVNLDIFLFRLVSRLCGTVVAPPIMVK